MKINWISHQPESPLRPDGHLRPVTGGRLEEVYYLRLISSRYARIASSRTALVKLSATSAFCAAIMTVWISTDSGSYIIFWVRSSESTSADHSPFPGPSSGNRQTRWKRRHSRARASRCCHSEAGSLFFISTILPIGSPFMIFITALLLYHCTASLSLMSGPGRRDGPMIRSSRFRRKRLDRLCEIWIFTVYCRFPVHDLPPYTPPLPISRALLNIVFSLLIICTFAS